MMGFDFLLVQPQAFIEKKKPRLRRYTWQAMPAFIRAGRFPSPEISLLLVGETLPKPPIDRTVPVRLRPAKQCYFSC